jgi:hypothetical protein
MRKAFIGLTLVLLAPTLQTWAAGTGWNVGAPQFYQDGNQDGPFMGLHFEIIYFQGKVEDKDQWTIVSTSSSCVNYAAQAEGAMVQIINSVGKQTFTATKVPGALVRVCIEDTVQLNENFKKQGGDVKPGIRVFVFDVWELELGKWTEMFEQLFGPSGKTPATVEVITKPGLNSFKFNARSDKARVRILGEQIHLSDNFEGVR